MNTLRLWTEPLDTNSVAFCLSQFNTAYIASRLHHQFMNMGTTNLLLAPQTSERPLLSCPRTGFPLTLNESGAIHL